jgi:hypothetical protein
MLLCYLTHQCLFPIVFTAPFVRAESDDVEDSEEADINEAAEDADPTEVDEVPEQQQRPAEEVFTTYLFPDYADKSMSLSANFFLTSNKCKVVVVLDRIPRG